MNKPATRPLRFYAGPVSGPNPARAGAGAGTATQDAAIEPGILHPARSRQAFDYRRHDPDPRLAPFVENFWTITWSLPAGEEFTAQVLPYPCVNASVTNTEADVTGVTRTRYDRRLVGDGYAVGVRFRPGCFRPFVAGPVSTLTDTHRPIAEVMGRSTTTLQRAVAATDDVTQRVSLLTEFLLGDLPEFDPVCDQLARLVDDIAHRPEITRVSQVAAAAASSARRLQRLFDEYVGAGPKWVILRCRLQEAASRAADDDPPDWAELAATLGFADQSHLTRAFTRTIGVPPASYATVQRRASPPLL